MKKILILILLFIIVEANASTSFTAVLVKNNTYLSIHMIDDHLIPPFEAGELWKILNGNEQLKVVKEKELSIRCVGLSNQTNNVFGNCTLLFPYSEFKKYGDKMVFKAEGAIAAGLNRHFIDSAYMTMQRNAVYLSAYTTRRLFFFGINENLIQK